MNATSPAEFETAHIANSYNVPLDVLENHAGDVARRLQNGRNVILVCRSGQRATRARALLRDIGSRDGLVRARCRARHRGLGADGFGRQTGTRPGAIATQQVRHVTEARPPQHAGGHHRAGTACAVDDDGCALIDLRQRIRQRR